MGLDISTDAIAIERLRLARAAGQARALGAVGGRRSQIAELVQLPSGKAVEYRKPLRRDELELWSAPLLKRLEPPIREALARCGRKREEIEEVLLVGGMTRMPAVRREIARVDRPRAERDREPRGGRRGRRGARGRAPRGHDRGHPADRRRRARPADVDGAGRVRAGDRAELGRADARAPRVRDPPGRPGAGSSSTSGRASRPSRRATATSAATRSSICRRRPRATCWCWSRSRSTPTARSGSARASWSRASGSSSSSCSTPGSPGPTSSRLAKQLAEAP